MSRADVSLAVFTACNMLRLVAYLPQLVRISRDTQGAVAISYSSWIIFAVSNLSTAVYGFAVMADRPMALLFGASTLCCFAIIALTAYKRARYRARLTGKSPVVLSVPSRKDPAPADAWVEG